jgi:putative peptidoglycan lipid II flippase
MWPSLIAGAAVQVNVMINGMFASEINGARSWLHYAFRLMQFPIGVFGVAIATVTLPAVARHHARSDLEAVGRTVEESLRLAVYLTVPAAVGLFVLAPDIIGIVYERGCFSAADTARTAAALRAFSVGLAGYASIKVLVPCFYALNRPRTPLRVSLLAMGLNAGLNLLLVKGFGLGHVGLAVTTGVLALVNVLQLVWHLRRLVAFGTARAWGRMLLAVGTGSALCGVAAWGVKQGVMPGPSAGVLPRVTALGAAVGAGALTYFGAALAMGLAEAEATRDWARRLWTRLRRARTSASSVEPRARPPCP